MIFIIVVVIGVIVTGLTINSGFSDKKFYSNRSEKRTEWVVIAKYYVLNININLK